MKTVLNFISFILIIALIAGCMSPFPSQTTERYRLTRDSAPYFGSFDKVWSERTITLPSEGSDGPGMMLPFTGGGNPDEAFAFPLTVHATYIDSVLVETGISDFSRLSGMTGDDVTAYKERYTKAHITKDTLFIWVEMQTTSTADFLNLRRWTIFIENDEGKDFEPARIVEHPIERSNRQFYPPGNRNRAGSPSVPDLRFTNLVKKNIELYFPIRRFDDLLFTHSSTHLKFVILDTEHPLVRAEASWTLASLRNN